MTNPNSALPALLPAQAAELLRGAAALMADHVATALPGMVQPALEYLASRQDSGAGPLGARRLLGSGRDELRRGLLANLKKEQDERMGRLLARETPGAGPKTITADALSLVDDEADSPADAVAPVARRIRGAIEDKLKETNVITAYLAGKESLRADNDPFDPEACMSALLQAARDLGLEAAGWSSLLGAMEKPMAEALAAAHLALREHYRRHGIDIAEIRKDKAAKQALGKSAGGPSTRGGPTTQSSAAKRLAWLDEVPRADTVAPGLGGGAGGGGGGGPGGGVGGGPGGGAGGAPGGGGAWPPVVEARASLDNMIERMSSAARGLPVPVSLAAAGKPPPDLMEAISEMQRLGAREAAPQRAEAAMGQTVTGVPTFAPAAVADQGVWRDALLAKSTRTVDKLTIEIVGMLFEHVLQDGQVPAEIKAVLSRLQFPVLKVALTDADFFASGAHPARRLIDRLASTAVGWEPYGDENQRYKAEIERIVQQVLERFDKDLGTFEQLLGEFEAFLGEMPVREADPIARAKLALEEAEKREVLVINTTIQVRRAFERVELEPYLREFLVGPWVQALVSATLRDEQTPGFSKAFRQVIHDLVWSVQPKVSAEERKRLMTLIPEMTRVLRDGLGLVRMSQDDQQVFLKQLMASHAVAVRPVDQATYIKSKVATGDLRQKLDDMHISGTFPIGAGGGGVQVSVNAVKRAAANHSAQLVVAEPLQGSAPLSYEQEADFDARIAGWQRGSWFNLYDGRETVKVKLRWISPLRTLFMFSSGGEEKGARVLSPETIKSYLRQGWLKPLEAEPLMKRAVERVVGDFERSPKRAEQLAEKIGATMAAKPTTKAAFAEAPKLP